jgi:hypothetical protein
VDVLAQPFQIGRGDRLEPWRHAALHKDSKGPETFSECSAQALLGDDET